MAGQPVPIDPAWHYPISLDMYHQMIDAGILRAEDRVELLEGSIVSMSPQEKPHSFAVNVLSRQLMRQLPEHLGVRTQSPLTLARSEPEPDIAVVEVAHERDARRHPERALLVVEVADSSLAKDRRTKAPIYAVAGIAEYWIVDVSAHAIDVLRDPDPSTGTYRATARVTNGALTCAAISGITVDVDALFA